MDSELTMTVSPMTGPKENRKYYVLFSDKNRSIEICLPENKVVSNKGFSDEEISELLAYTSNEKETIEKMASSVNPLKAFMGK